jgi:hypothetical protein
MSIIVVAAILLIAIIALLIAREIYRNRPKEKPSDSTPLAEMMARARNDDERRMLIAKEAFQKNRIVIANEDDDGNWDVRDYDYFMPKLPGDNEASKYGR